MIISQVGRGLLVRARRVFLVNLRTLGHRTSYYCCQQEPPPCLQRAWGAATPISQAKTTTTKESPLFEGIVIIHYYSAASLPTRVQGGTKKFK